MDMLDFELIEAYASSRYTGNNTKLMKLEYSQLPYVRDLMLAARANDDAWIKEQVTLGYRIGIVAPNYFQFRERVNWRLPDTWWRGLTAQIFWAAGLKIIGDERITKLLVLPYATELNKDHHAEQWSHAKYAVDYAKLKKMEVRYEHWS